MGANDVANAMGTSVGSKVISLKQAVLIAAIFEAFGAMFASSEVTTTIRQSVVDLSYFETDIQALTLGMVTCLLASATWLILATYFAWPVSTTHSIIGSLVGFAYLVKGHDAIHWMTLTGIFLSWLTGPLISALIGYLLFRSIQRLILSNVKPIRCAKFFLPFYGSLVGFFISLPVLLKQFESMLPIVMYSILVGVLFSIPVLVISWRSDYDELLPLDNQLSAVEKMFGVLVVMTASLMAFSHGSNDVANAIGPLSVIIGLEQHGIAALSQSEIPASLLLFGAGGIVIGLAVYGYRIIETVGNQITSLTPTRSFSAQLSTSVVMVVATCVGLPISTTQILVGSILGVGMARGLQALNIRIVKNIFMSWVVTLPSGACLSIVYYIILDYMIY